MNVVTFEENKKFERLYAQYSKLAYHIALKILGNMADAEDAVQQAFLSILEHLEKVGEVESPATKAYLCKIVEHKAIDLIRAKKRFVSMDNCADRYAPPPDELHPLTEAIARLPKRYQEVLVLQFIEGYDTQEIAEMLDMKRGTVQKTSWRAKEMLAKLIQT